MNEYKNKSPEYLHNKYKSKIKDNSKSIAQLELYISKNYEGKKLDELTSLANRLKNFFALNIKNSALNSLYKLDVEDFNIIAYKINEPKKNRAFLQSDEFDETYVFFELKTKSVYSNSAELNNLLLLEKGINQIDINEKTNDYYLYLRLLDEKYNNKD